MSEWISVDERMPTEECALFLACHRKRQTVALCYVKVGGGRFGVCYTDHNFDAERFTDWMPFPELPK
jgi:hypothetical protein